MNAEGNQGAGSDRDCVLGVGALAVLIKKGNEEESGERTGHRGGGDLRGDEKWPSWANV